MSGYEGAGTNMDGPEFEGGAGVADTSIAGAAPNSDLSLAGTYGGNTDLNAAIQGAALTSAVGANAFGNSNMAGADIADSTTIVSTAPPVSLLNVVQNTVKGALALLGIASGTPQGVLGGGLSLSNMVASTANKAPAGISFADASEFGFGFSGESRSAFSGFAGSAAPNLFAGSDGPPDAGFIAGAPVLGFAGAVAPGQAASAPSGAGVGLAGFAPGAALQYPAGFAPGAPAQSSGAGALLLLAGLASLFFMG